jgi:hypothetical protein
MRREELRVIADELLREVDAATINLANGHHADALEHLWLAATSSRQRRDNRLELTRGRGGLSYHGLTS